MAVDRDPSNPLGGDGLLASLPPVRPRVFLSCGEASGDLYAGELVRELRHLRADVECFGLGGERMARAGAELLVGLDEVSVIGLVEVLAKIPALRRTRAVLLEAALLRRPHVAVLIDFSGFNLRLSRKLRQWGVPIVYYVSPQVWAWRRGRVKTIRETAEKMLVILPFEESFYKAEGVPVSFVGHPLVDLVRCREDRETFCKRVGVEPNRPLIAVLPGSRRREIELHVPILARAIEIMATRRADLEFIILRAPTVEVTQIVARLGRSARRVRVAEDSTYEGLAHAAVAVVASGTATVEAALCRTPMVVVYRVGRLSYQLGNPFVRVPHYAMVNLICGRRLVPELIQDDMTEEAVACEALKLLDEPAAAAMRRDLAEVRSLLGEEGASRRAAREVMAVASAHRELGNP